MSKIINAVLSKFSAKYKSIDELGKLYLAQFQPKHYAARTIQNKTCYVNHVCRLFSGRSVSQLTPAKVYRTLEAFNEVRSQTAKCTLIERRHMLTLALKFGWVDVVQLLGHLDYKITAVYLSRRRREQPGWRYIVRQPATGGGSGEHATAAVRA